MRILYHHRTRCTDAQRVHILEIVNALRALGHEVQILSVANSEKAVVDEVSDPAWKKLVRAIPLAYELAQLAYNLLALPWLLYRIRNFQPAFLYERYSLMNFAGVLAARMCGKPMVLEVNSPFALEQVSENEIRAARLAKWMERVICNSASCVIVVSGPLKRIMAANGVHESKMVIMPNGVNLQHVRAGGSEELRLRLGLRGKTVIGFVGWFRRWHGLEFLIDAFAHSDLASRGAALIFIGDGPAMPGLRAQAAARLPEGAVVFTGGIPHEEIPGYLNVIDIAVQPAANPYCCPMKIIEYMGLGKAIVAPKQENIEELLTDGSEALLFAPGSQVELERALGRLVDDENLRADLGRAALTAIHTRGMLWSSNAEAVIRHATAVSALETGMPEPELGFRARR
jgi:glycosyltransferase involved in cell wall biosynthesis